MRRLAKPQAAHSYEFELDLAPLLAVMVKLVPVLLLSSAFVQLMVIETELPQAVKEAIQANSADKTTTIQLFATVKDGFTIEINSNGQSEQKTVALKDGKLDLLGLHTTLIEVKKLHPDVFRLEFNPSAELSYKEIVKIMDEARATRDRTITFPVMDKKTNQQINTPFMYPDIHFGNMNEG
jgi:biopolymer transport protein ExbD